MNTHTTTAPSRYRHLRWLFLAIIACVLVACQPPQSGTPTGSDGDTSIGYVSGDGSVRVWDPSERTEPVELAGNSMDGQPLDLAEWRGQVVVLNFWYAACPPCRAEAPDLAELSDAFDGQAQFLGVNHIDSPDTALAFERSFEIPYPTLHDENSAGVAALGSIVPLQAMPTTVVLDTEGRVAARILGLIDRSTLQTLIEDNLEPITSASRES